MFKFSTFFWLKHNYILQLKPFSAQRKSLKYPAGNCHRCNRNIRRTFRVNTTTHSGSLFVMKSDLSAANSGVDIDAGYAEAEVERGAAAANNRGPSTCTSLWHVGPMSRSRPCRTAWHPSGRSATRSAPPVGRSAPPVARSAFLMARSAAPVPASSAGEEVKRSTWTAHAPGLRPAM